MGYYLLLTLYLINTSLTHIYVRFCIFDNLMFILTKSHLGSYPCPLNINFYWNMGFTLGIVIVVQIVTGLFLSFHYSSDLHEAYFSVFFLIREIYYGWSLRFLHSSGASFVFLFLFLHLGRSLFYGSFFYNPNTWFTGILILLLLMGIAFLIEWVCGGYCVNSPTLKRFFIFHFVLPYVTIGFLVVHIYFLHFHSSNNPSRLITNNKISFFPFIFIKDLVFVSGILCLYYLQTHLGISSLSHPDNALEACSLLTPLHIVPEWYFLCQYAMLKAVPNKMLDS